MKFTAILASPWKRIIAFLILFSILYTIISFINSLVIIVNVFTAAVLASIFTEKSRIGGKFRTIGFNPDRWMIKEISVGLLLVVIADLVFLVISSINGIGIDFHSLSPLHLIIGQTAMIFIIASSEELIFRGIIFQALLSKYGTSITVIFSSFIFGLIHVSNSGFTWIAFTNTLFANILLSEMYILSKSLWLPVTWHFAWNWGQAFILGCPVSGYLYDYYFLNIHSDKLPEWLFGGAYGIEGGLIVTFILMISSIILPKLVQPSPYLSSQLFQRDYEESILLS